MTECKYAIKALYITTINQKHWIDLWGFLLGRRGGRQLPYEGVIEGPWSPRVTVPPVPAELRPVIRGRRPPGVPAGHSPNRAPAWAFTHGRDAGKRHECDDPSACLAEPAAHSGSSSAAVSSAAG